MAVDKLVDSTILDACCTAEANAIKAKTGNSAQIAYDFANSKGFADAIAAIPSVNAEIFEYTSSAAGADQNVVIVSGNDKVAAHWNDDNALVTIRKMTNNSSNGLALVVAGNKLYGGTAYGSYVNFNTTTNNTGLIITPLKETTTPTTINIRCTASGDIIVKCVRQQNNFGGATYLITFSW